MHVYGRPELFAARGDFRLRALSLERFGLGDHLAALERLKRKLADEGLFAAERKRRLPLLSRRIGLVTGNDAAAKRDVLTAITTRFPPAKVLVAETYVQGPRAAAAVVEALGALCREPGVDVVVVARGGGSFEDLLPFSDERLVRAIADCSVPVVSRRRPRAGHAALRPRRGRPRLDTQRRRPARGARPAQLLERLDRTRAGLERGTRHTLERERLGLERTHERLGRAPRLLVERGRAKLEHSAGRLRALSPKATLERGYAIVRADERIVRSGAAVQQGERVEVELADGGFGARVEECERRREPTFEEAQRELEQIVQRLESGEAPLDEALKLWERGEELYRFCKERLDTAEGKIEELAGRAGRAERSLPVFARWPQKRTWLDHK